MDLVVGIVRMVVIEKGKVHRFLSSASNLGDFWIEVRR
jgi:hypothetical protein